MAVYQRGDTYWVEYMWHGERIRFSAKTSNKTIARQVETSDKNERALGRAGITQRAEIPTLGVFLAGKFTDHYKLHVKPATARSYAYGVEIAQRYGLAAHRMDEITNEHVTAIASKMRADGLSIATVNTVIKVYRRALSLAAEWDIIGKRPKLSLVKGANEREHVLTGEEIDTYLAACTGLWRVMAHILVFTGARPNEARMLRWENVSFENRTIQIVGGKTKNAKRQLPIRARLQGVLLAHWDAAGQPLSGFVLPSPQNGDKPLGDYGNTHRDVCKGLGVSFVAYTFRHTALTQLGAAGCDAFTLMKIAGHASIAMTARYVHPQADAMRRAFDGMDTPKTPHIVPPSTRRAA